MAKKKLELNESVEVTFKDGSIKIYESIKFASDETGLSENSIKSRCNKPGTGAKSKDGITCRWADEHTRRVKTAKKSKNKGNAAELEIIHKLRELGYEGCVSSRSVNKLADANKIDIIDTNDELPCLIQVKYTQNTPNYFSISEACTDKSKPFTIFWKKATNDGTNSPGTVVMLPDWYFYNLINKKQ